MMLRLRAYHRGALFLAGSVLAFCGLPPAARACPYSIRDAGFIVREPRPYKLYIFVADDTPGKDELAQWLATAWAALLPDSNVEAALVNIDRQGTHDAMIHFHQLRPDALPVAILVSPRDAAMVVASFGPAGISEREVWELVASVVSSPRREELLKHIITDWCVLIVVKGTDAGENRRAERAAAAAAKAIVGMVTEMGVVIGRPPRVMSVSWDDPRERIFLWSLGFPEKYAGRTGVAVVFGMGRRLGQVLTGQDLEEAMVLGLLELLGRNCTCTSDPSWLLGPVAPLVWGEDRYRQVRDELGFDPNHPAVAATLSGVWTSLGATGFAGDDLATIGGGYMEFSLESLEADGDSRSHPERASETEPDEAPDGGTLEPEPPSAADDASSSATDQSEAATAPKPAAERAQAATAEKPGGPSTDADAGSDKRSDARETSLSSVRGQSEAVETPRPRQLDPVLKAARAAAQVERRTSITLLIFIAVLGVVAGAGGAVLVLRRNRRL